jgi:sigma-E factor negative regulatory protein RseC
MAKGVEHEGVITAISKDVISVEIISKSACSACHAKGMCSASDMKNKVVDVPLTTYLITEDYKVGERVMVTLEESLALNAVLLAYGVPLVLLIISLVGLSSFVESELVVGLSSIAIITIYYIILYFLKEKLERVYNFTIHRL